MLLKGKVETHLSEQAVHLTMWDHYLEGLIQQKNFTNY